MAISIQKIEPADVRQYFGVIKELRPQIANEKKLMELVQKMTKHEEVYFFGASDERIPVGFASCLIQYKLSTNGSYAFVYDLIVSETHRSKKIGKKLLDEVYQFAKQQGCLNLELCSGTSRHQAHKFYLNQGFHISAYCFEKAIS